MGNGCTRPIRLLQSFFPHSRTCGVQSRDLLFMKIVNTYNAREVFTTTELKDDIIAQYAEVIEDDGCPNVCQITPVRLSLWHLSFGQPLHMAMQMTSRDCPYPNWAWMCQKHNCATSKTWDAASDKSRDPESYTVRPTSQQGARVYTQRMANKPLQPYQAKQVELSVQEGCLMWGKRVIVPDSLKEWVLQKLHKEHLGITKMKAVAQNHVWWTGIDKDLDSLITLCSACLSHCKTSTSKGSIAPMDFAKSPMAATASGFCRLFFGKSYHSAIKFMWA